MIALPPSPRPTIILAIVASLQVRDTKYFKGLAERFKNGASSSRASSHVGLGAGVERSGSEGRVKHAQGEDAKQEWERHDDLEHRDRDAGLEEFANSLRGGGGGGGCQPCPVANVSAMNMAAGLGAGAF